MKSFLGTLLVALAAASVVQHRRRVQRDEALRVRANELLRLNGYDKFEADRLRLDRVRALKVGRP